ncbi:MAG: PQQ-dependent sugar dehydrogenase [Myxococcales bacterium]|nr:PQQ-dependent sugar dehydrogenase [Myxococcales bacterium]
MKLLRVMFAVALGVSGCSDDAPGSAERDVGLDQSGAMDGANQDGRIDTSPDVTGRTDTADSGQDTGHEDSGVTFVDASDLNSNDVRDLGERIPTCGVESELLVSNASVPDGFCAYYWATGLGSPRGLTIAPNGDVLVVNRNSGQVLATFDQDGDGVSGDEERAVIASASGLNHGIAVDDGYLYASSSTTVYRWAYSGERSDLGASSVVISGIPGGGHSTRTLVFDDEGNLYVSVGSASNVDSDSSRSRIRRFSLDTIPEGGISFGDGEVFADGMRNEVGLTFDGRGRLWGVENGFDNANRDDLGGDVHQDNPAEELNLIDSPGRFYGYPYCWTEYQLEQGLGRGTQWAHESFMNDGTHSDAWCRNPENVVRPALAMQGHSAPLGLSFYNGNSFPAAYQGDIFIAFHGSWNRDEPTGYKVVHVPMVNGLPAGQVNDFLEYGGNAGLGDWPHRPVDVAVAPNGQLLISSDASGVIIAIGHE